MCRKQLKWFCTCSEFGSSASWKTGIRIVLLWSRKFCFSSSRRCWNEHRGEMKVRDTVNMLTYSIRGEVYEGTNITVNIVTSTSQFHQESWHKVDRTPESSDRDGPWDKVTTLSWLIYVRRSWWLTSCFILFMVIVIQGLIRCHVALWTVLICHDLSLGYVKTLLYRTRWVWWILAEIMTFALTPLNVFVITGIVLIPLMCDAMPVYHTFLITIHSRFHLTYER